MDCDKQEVRKPHDSVAFYNFNFYDIISITNNPQYLKHI